MMTNYSNFLGFRAAEIALAPVGIAMQRAPSASQLLDITREGLHKHKRFSRCGLFPIIFVDCITIFLRVFQCAAYAQRMPTITKSGCDAKIELVVLPCKGVAHLCFPPDF